MDSNSTECSKNALVKWMSYSLIVCLSTSPSVSLFVCQLQLQESQRMVQGRIRTGETELQEFQQTLESLKVTKTQTHSVRLNDSVACG